MHRHVHQLRGLNNIAKNTESEKKSDIHVLSEALYLSFPCGQVRQKKNLVMVIVVHQ